MADIRKDAGEEYGAIASAVSDSLSRPGQVEDTSAGVTENGADVERAAHEVDGPSASATMPEARNCCGPSCCA